MSAKPVSVSVHDPETGETETADVPANSYVLVTGERMELDGIQRYGNGTVILTIKRKPAGEKPCSECDGRGEVAATRGRPEDGPMECPVCAASEATA